MPPENDNADWGRTVEIAACDRWELEHVAGDIAAPGWYDALTTRMLSEAADACVSVFGSIGPHTPIEAKAARYRVQEGGSPLWSAIIQAVVGAVVLGSLEY